MSLIRNKIILAATLLAFTLAANAFEYEKQLENPEQEQTAHKIFKEIRCIVCDGESLAGSNAEFSINMRALIREKLKAGEGEEEVIAYLTDRYGNAILQKPPFEMATYLLWLAPLLFFVVGVFALRKKSVK